MNLRSKMVDIYSASSIIGLSHNTLKKWVTLNQIPFIREGGRPLFKEADCIHIRNLMIQHGSEWRKHFRPEDAATAAQIARRVVDEQVAAFLNQKRGTK